MCLQTRPSKSLRTLSDHSPSIVVPDDAGVKQESQYRWYLCTFLVLVSL